MTATLPQRFRAISSELVALAEGHWMMFRQEMSGKIAMTRQQTALMVAGAVIALTSILLFLSALTLFLSELFVSQFYWSPLLAGGTSALLIGLLFAMGGWLLIRRGGLKLKEEGFTPVHTLHSLKTAAQTLTNQPVVPTPPPTPMKTRQEFQDALHQTADTVGHQARRAGRAVSETARSVQNQFDPGAFFSQALNWVDSFLTPQNRALAGRALTAASFIPRRHPGVAAALGLGAAYMWYKKNRTPDPEDVAEYAAARARECRDLADQARRTAAEGYRSAVHAGKDLKSSLFDTAHKVAENGRAAASQFSTAATATAEAVRDTYDYTRDSLGEGVEQLTRTARQLREDAEAGMRKAREFAKEEPAIAIAGGLALAVGAFLLVKSSRR